MNTKTIRSLIKKPHRLCKKIIAVYRFMFLFILMIIFFIVKATCPHEYLQYVASITFLILIVYSLAIISDEKPLLWHLSLAMGALAIGLSLCDLIWPHEGVELLMSVISISFYVIMIYTCLYFSFYDEVVSVTTLFGSLCAYLFIGLTFSSLYELIHHLNNQAFSNVVHFQEDLVYFSFVTLTTLGYGDIQPLSSLARTLAWLEAYLGQAYLTVLMALMVGRYLKHHQEA